KTFSNQARLPRLPIPTLENLREKYLASVKPLLSEEAYARTEQVVNKFVSPEGLGQVLQQRLIEHDNAQEESWLEDLWLDQAYLGWRAPTLINSNWWTQFKDRDDVKPMLLKRPPPENVLTAFQIKRAAELITNLVNFNELVNNEQIPPEDVRGTPLCMNQYKHIFSASRIPGVKKDTIQTTWPAKATHIVVLTDDQIYKVEVTREDGKRIPIQELERLLFAVGRSSFETMPQPAIGALTAISRDKWAASYEHLKSLSPQNQVNLDIINSALFVLCLDKKSNHKNFNISSQQFFHNGDARNRWFDKTFQLIVASNGRAGVNGEHSPLDAVIPSNMFDYILENEPAVDPEGASVSPYLPLPVKLEWVVDDVIESAIEAAQEESLALIEKTQHVILQSTVYGHRFMKEVAQSSPDAFVQLLLQLVWYRMRKTPTAVYESISTRFFNHGRTETARSMTSETLAFIKAFDDDNITYDEKRILCGKALIAQAAVAKSASYGQGIDRHLLGLRAMIRPSDSAKDTIFTDPAFATSMHFRLSTSSIQGKHHWGGFGPAVDDGYGISYAIDLDGIKFSVSCRKDVKAINPKKFRIVLERTMIDLMAMFPKRTEVWGKNWKAEQKAAKVEQKYFEQMRDLKD
ncbi:acyltransferase ChoActase/COT/CPT, partial [Blyttiomyces helicus]